MEGGRQPGAYSVSLAVKDIQASREFHEKRGFEVAGGDRAQNWLILRNTGHTIGRFQRMFEGATSSPSTLAGMTRPNPLTTLTTPVKSNAN